MLVSMSSAKIHREPFLHLVDLAHDRVLIAWGTFYFERTEQGRWEIIDDDQLPVRVGRHTCIGAGAEPFGHARVQVTTTDGKVAAEVSTDERAWVWVEGLEPEDGLPLSRRGGWSRLGCGRAVGLGPQ